MLAVAIGTLLLAGSLAVEDAAHVSLQSLRVVDSAGSHGAYSPDGRYILYIHGRLRGVVNARTPSAWLLDRQSGARTQIIDNASACAWSPDGALIACQGNDAMRVFKVTTGDIVTLGPPVAASPSEMYWTKDGKHVALVSRLFANYEAATVALLDIDTLKIERPAGNWLGGSKWDVGLPSWIVDQMGVRQHPTVRFAATQDPPCLRADDADWNYGRCLIRGAIGHQVALSPTGSHLLFDIGPGSSQSGLSGLVEATLDWSRVPPPTKFRAALSGPELLRIVRRCPLYFAWIAAPRLNPLNGKTIGSQGPPKAIARITPGASGSRLDVTFELQPSEPVQEGDVLSLLIGDRDGSYCGREETASHFSDAFVLRALGEADVTAEPLATDSTGPQETHGETAGGSVRIGKAEVTLELAPSVPLTRFPYKGRELIVDVRSSSALIVGLPDGSSTSLKYKDVRTCEIDDSPLGGALTLRLKKTDALGRTSYSIPFEAISEGTDVRPGSPGELRLRILRIMANTTCELIRSSGR